MSTATLTRPAPARELVGIDYRRISRFRVSQRGAEVEVERGVDRQGADNAAVAENMGVPLVRSFVDNNRSASEFATREREAWVELMELVRGGGVTHVFVWLLDRIIRTTSDLDDLLAACKASGAVIVQSASGSVIDPNNPEAKLHAKISGAVAEYETAKMSMRIRRQKESAAMQGRPHGGKRWFGYEAGNMTPDEIEAPIYRKLVGEFLGGASLHSLATGLTDKGVPTVTGSGVWTAPAVRAILLNPRYAGRRIHKGDDVGPGAWPALIDEATSESVRRKLNNPERRTNNGQNARVYLLAGLGVCATCGADLRGRPLHNTTKTRDGGDYGDRAYACKTGKHCHRSVAYVDAVVELAVIARLSRTDAAGVLVDDDAADEARALSVDRDAVRARLDALADEYADGALDAKAYARATARIDAKLAELDELVGQASERAKAPVAVLDGMTGDGARAAWDAADLGRRRAIVGLLLSRVALRGGPGPFVPELVELDWR